MCRVVARSNMGLSIHFQSIRLPPLLGSQKFGPRRRGELVGSLKACVEFAYSWRPTCNGVSNSGW